MQRFAFLVVFGGAVLVATVRCSATTSSSPTGECGADGRDSSAYEPWDASLADVSVGAGGEVSRDDCRRLCSVPNCYVEDIPPDPPNDGGAHQQRLQCASSCF
jgi:hypothetical protein